MSATYPLTANPSTSILLALGRVKWRSRSNPSRRLPNLFPTMLEPSVEVQHITPFLTAEDNSAVIFVKSLSYLKILQHFSKDLAYPKWQSEDSAVKNAPQIQRVLKILESRSPINHEFVVARYFSAKTLAHRDEWARYCFTVMGDLVLIQQYRQHLFPDGLVSPIAVKAVRQVYDLRLSQLGLNEKVWLNASASLDNKSKSLLGHDFKMILEDFDRALYLQAKEDAESVTPLLSREIGEVKKIAIIENFYQTYRQMYISAAFAIPRFKWQLRSTLSKTKAAEVAEYFR